MPKPRLAKKADKMTCVTIPHSEKKNEDKYYTLKESILNELREIRFSGVPFTSLGKRLLLTDCIPATHSGGWDAIDRESKTEEENFYKELHWAQLRYVPWWKDGHGIPDMENLFSTPKEIPWKWLGESKRASLKDLFPRLRDTHGCGQRLDEMSRSWATWI